LLEGPDAGLIPEANAFAENGARELGGIATTFLTEILFDIPTAVHCMVGCAMARSPSTA
jgi:cholesterol oxidase